MTLRGQVTEFHHMIGAPVRATPRVPPDDRVRLRLRLIAEEFFELLGACNLAPDVDGYGPVEHAVMACINETPLTVDLPEFADALADLDYVIEGSRLEFGIDGAPIAAEVHRSNLAKRGGPVDATGKQRKPEGWQPPDIAGELRRQGWTP